MKNKRYFIAVVVLSLVSSCNVCSSYGNKDIRNIISLDKTITNNSFLSCNQTLLADNYIRSLFDKKCEHSDNELLTDYNKRFELQNINELVNGIRLYNVPFSLEMTDGTIEKGEKTATLNNNIQITQYKDYKFNLSFNLMFNLSQEITDYYDTGYRFMDLTIDFYLKSYNKPSIKVYSVALSEDNYFDYASTKDTSVILVEQENDKFIFTDYKKYKRTEPLNILINTSQWFSGGNVYEDFVNVGHSFLLYCSVSYRTDVDIIQLSYCNVKTYRLFIANDKPAFIQTSPCGFTIQKEWLKRNDIYGCVCLDDPSIYMMDCL